MERLPLACALLLLLGMMNLYHVMATPQEYWARSFPNTLMPDDICARLRPVPLGLLHMGSDGRDPRFIYTETLREYNDPKETTLFLEKKLKVGMRKLFHFPKSDFNNASPFLPREAADAIPFSSAEVPRILQIFSLPPASIEAKEVHRGLAWCESLAANEKCPTSLEAMIDYATSSGLYNNITVLHTSIEKASVLQVYTVKKVGHDAIKPSSAVCHNMPYPYALYYCHFVKEGRIHKVALKGEDGNVVEAIAVCHSNIRSWPLWVIPTGGSIKADNQNYACHFLPDTHIVWASA
ncbi:BURP domain-containing protein 3 isoform X2 [Amborella trichopoda]|uniref:BURP domain-containing protein 3 isoform X2 n=1 Tax=Amborella trichopoda TaxID=13333 RepID=UPI0009C009F4|nr:BURP domain-containing protein 3 isoform X2 [Amborella trichopoda]|eukprot:XP_020527500.1 BURP domain-containing protein 3 isoform X2 [Amborella trichopoda]